MARRGIVVVFTLLGIALFISIAGFALLYLALGREPAVPSNATLVLRVGGELAEIAPADVVGYLRGVRTPTVRSIVDNLRKAKVDSRVRAVLLKPTGFESPFWGKVQEIRDAVLDFKKSGKPVYAYLEYGGDREYYLATAADKVFLMPSSPLDLTRRRHLRAVPARHARQDRRVSRPAPHRRLQDRGEHLHREGLHAGAQGDGRVAQPRSVRADRARHRRRRARRTRPTSAADRRRPVPARGRAARRAWSTMWPTRIRSTTSCAAAGSARRHRRRRLRARQLSSLGLNRGPRIAVIYAAGDDHQRQERLRPAERRGRRFGHADRVHPPGPARHARCARSCCASTAPADRRRRPTRSGAS